MKLCHESGSKAELTEVNSSDFYYSILQIPQKNKKQKKLYIISLSKVSVILVRMQQVTKEFTP